ncbi:ABC transporter substrate-binding protein [Antribacter sp. KLBMP9083]|uniref:ABC transporter substrate-binding protein n=1 Tax=Antribacter soli TaxID=2910976 RepID=A0AA41QEC4_9MICO|nr:ABC transporter substrate-binding protein [Antribacter soli]MCF4121893.1 ABC transporter substrate-binding protein [Antribacter soli]
MKRSPLRVGLAGLSGIALLTLTACAAGDPLSADAAGGSGSGVVIGSADFSESQLIATIYSLALQDAGVEVEEKFNIGSREVYIAAVQDGSIDLVPDYAGALLKYLDTESTATSTEDVIAELGEVLPDDLAMLEASAAQDKDVLAVTRETAEKYGLETISDLQPVAGEISLGAPPEWKTRVNGVLGLEDVYGLTFKEFVSLDAGGPLTLAALTSGQVQAADVFSTDPAIAENDLVSLEDDKFLFAAENVVPIVRSDKVSDTITEALNEVSGALTTEDLIAMNGRAATGESLEDIASDWLTEAGLL